VKRPLRAELLLLTKMSSGNVEETSPTPPPIYRELSATIQDQLNIIVASATFANDATLETAFGHVKQLAKLILDAPNAVPQWHADDLEEQLATAMRINNRLATLEGPTQGKADRIPDPPVFEGTREGLEGFIAQLRIKLFSDPFRYPTPALRMGYTFNRLAGRAQAQVLPFVQNGNFLLNDSDDIIHILENAFGDPNPAATARSKLHSLKPGKKEFVTYFAEFQMLVAKPNWGEEAKLDALKEGISIELRCQLLGRRHGLTFDQFVALCQRLDSEIRALQHYKGRGGNPSNQQRPTQNVPRTHPPVPNPPSTGVGPDPIILSGTGYGKLSEQERATRIREGLCLYCGKPGHMARHCPSKSKNPFHTASAYVEGNPNVLASPDSVANTFSGGGGGSNRGGGGAGGQGQSGNA